MQSSFITWLTEQYFRTDSIGSLSKWLKSQKDFEPIEFSDIIDRIKKNNETNEMIDIAFQSMLEFAEESGIAQGFKNGTQGFRIIENKEVLEEKLRQALNSENYEEAAKLRDQLNKK